ncbi:MAG: hypothetical protein C0609_11900 [Deltaproteobacteria bacterium]|nr:MAG: hypothetical protein C0609_11900 [Deltaproteobacteria bacterium]
MGGISRRRFLEFGAAAVATTVATSKRSHATPNFEGYPEGMGVLVDLTKCIGCRSCEAACNKEHGLPKPEKPFDDLSVFDERGHSGQMRRPDETRYTVVNRYEPTQGGAPVYRKIQCNHCNEPACLTSCFVNAYTKTKEGAVVYNPEVCVGCRMCMTACPFYVPGYSYSSATNPVIVKCNFCYDKRLVNGLPPACVEICPQEALLFGHREELIAIGKARIKAEPDRYIDHIYGEEEVGGTSWMYISSEPFEELGFDTTLQKKPIISNVMGFLGMVPMVLAIWPALFTGFHLLAKKKGGEDGHDSERGEGE